MSHHENLDTVKRLYAAFGTGDLSSLLSTLDDGIDWAVPGSAPWSGQGRGHQHVQRFFEAFGKSASLEAFEPRSFVAKGTLTSNRERQRVPTGTCSGCVWEAVSDQARARVLVSVPALRVLHRLRRLVP